MNHLNAWENEIHRRLADHEAVPPAMGWEKLETALQKPVRIPFYKKGGFYVRAISAAACVAVAGLLVVEALDEEVSAPIQQLATVQPATKESLKVSPTRPLASTSEVPADEQAVATGRAKAMASSSTLAKAAPVPTENVTEEMAAEDGAPISTFSLRRAVAPTEKKEVPSESTAPTQTEKDAEIENRMLPSNAPRVREVRKREFHSKRTSSSRRWSLALNGGTGGASTSYHKGYYNAPARSNGFPFEGNTKGARDMDMLYALNMNQDVQSKVSHKFPVQWGLGVRFELSPRWSVGTGLTYTRLDTDVFSGSESSFYVQNLRMHYVGIPLEVSYTYFKSRPFNGYITAGGLIEKCVKGDMNTTFHMGRDYKSSLEGQDNLAKGLWQGSVNLAAGFQLNVLEQVGVYCEPGVSYFIPDGSSLPSIRHDKPWQFNIQAGVRYTFK